jgi:hypothetical protein
VLAWAHLPTSIVKIDVEGYELAVIEGAIETITTHRPALVVEIEEQHQPAGQSIDDVFGRISDLGYVLFAIGSAGPFPISRFERLSRVPWIFGGGPVMLMQLRAHLCMGM